MKIWVTEELKEALYSLTVVDTEMLAHLKTPVAVNFLVSWVPLSDIELFESLPLSNIYNTPGLSEQIS